MTKYKPYLLIIDGKHGGFYETAHEAIREAEAQKYEHAKVIHEPVIGVETTVWED